MLADVHTVAATRLRRDGWRYTTNRHALVEVLANSDRPLTISEILERRGDVAQSSAYRNLAILERAGVVHRVVTRNEFSHFELAEELTDHHHHHLVCSRCGSVEDVALSEAFEATLELEVARMARRHDLDAAHHRLDIVGTCSSCR